MQHDAVLGLAKLGGEPVIQHLKELYQSEDRYVQIPAAVDLAGGKKPEGPGRYPVASRQGFVDLPTRLRT
ncbi:MAG: hypothetical protein ACYSX1_13325 [Planctomycetota bacterium]|jgi:hypothetical protein